MKASIITLVACALFTVPAHAKAVYCTNCSDRVTQAIKTGL